MPMYLNNGVFVWVCVWPRQIVAHFSNRPVNCCYVAQLQPYLHITLVYIRSSSSLWCDAPRAKTAESTLVRLRCPLHLNLNHSNRVFTWRAFGPVVWMRFDGPKRPWWNFLKVITRNLCRWHRQGDWLQDRTFSTFDRVEEKKITTRTG